MPGWLEIGGGLILAGAVAQTAISLIGNARGRLNRSRRDAADAEFFRRRAALMLRAAEVERDKQLLSWTGLRKFTVTLKEEEAKDVVSFYLEPHDRKPLPPFDPGQFLTFQLRIPDQPKPVIRCYSLSETPLEREYYRVTIKRLDPPPNEPSAPRGVSSNFFHEALAVGDTVDVRAPGGVFTLDMTSERPVALIAGGVGITPLLSMVNTIAASGDDRETWLFYGVLGGSGHAMRAHFADLARDHPNIHIVTFYSDPEPDDRLGEHYDYEGRCRVEIVREVLGVQNYDFYICGPPPMIATVIADLEEWGVPGERIHSEAFSAKTIQSAPLPAAAKAAGEAAAIEVCFDRSGKTVDWRPDAGALLDLAEAHGVRLDFGCRSGSCGTCLTAIKSGEVDYLHRPGSPPEAGSCLACIAVPSGPLVLDA